MCIELRFEHPACNFRIHSFDLPHLHFAVSFDSHSETDPAMAQSVDNNGYGNDIGHGYHKSSLRKDQVENLANRTDISPEEKERRRHKLEEELAAGVVGAGILGYAGYHHHQKKAGSGVQEQQLQGGEKKHHHHLGL